ncbi:MAG: NAD(+) synthase, partial [Spirochaetaceae bacterium]|nr:NAD(+) synthase [Spirochaetaceae bacterium]
MAYGFVKAACVSPRLKVADCCFNAEKIIEAAETAAENGAVVIVFPELSITAYTCGDLFFQRALLKSAEEQLALIIEKTSKLGSLLFVGLPVARTEGIYNCAAAICGGQLLALYAKSYLPNYGEFYERRQFTPFQQNMET